MDLTYITRQVTRVARLTGTYLRTERKNFRQEAIIEKNTHDYVSYVDQEAEKMTVRELSNLLPEAGFITEEGTVKQSAEGLSWVIDPLDGTTNFIQDMAPYCVSIALREGEELLVGVVYEVCRDECFYAWKGGGAFLNDIPIHVSGNPIEKAFVGLELPYDAEAYKPVFLRAADHLYGKVASIRIGGSAASSLCYVAAGRYDGWGEDQLNIWDYAAGILLVREAGGKVTDFTGREDFSGKHHVVATNGIIHEEFRQVFI